MNWMLPSWTDATWLAVLCRVSSVSRIQLSLAKHVMTDTRHVFLQSVGADKFAEGIGLETGTT